MEKYYKKWFKILNIPAAILFVVVILVPFIMGMAYSFTAWRGSYFKGSEHWYGALVGFKNYIKVFHSQKFITSFIYTIIAMSKTPYIQYLCGFARHGNLFYHSKFIVTINSKWYN